MHCKALVGNYSTEAENVKQLCKYRHIIFITYGYADKCTRQVSQYITNNYLSWKAVHSTLCDLATLESVLISLKKCKKTKS